MYKKTISLILCLTAFFMAVGQDINTTPYLSAVDDDAYGNEIITVEGYVRMAIVDYAEGGIDYINEWPGTEALEGKEIVFILFSKGIPLTDYSTGEKNTYVANSFLLVGNLEPGNPKEFALKYVNRRARVRGPWYTDPMILADVMIDVINITLIE